MTFPESESQVPILRVEANLGCALGHGEGACEGGGDEEPEKERGVHGCGLMLFGGAWLRDCRMMGCDSSGVVISEV